MSQRSISCAARRRDRPPIFRAIGLLFVLMIANACAERGTLPPRIDRLGTATAEIRGKSIRVATANLWGVSVLGFDWADEIGVRFNEFAERLARNEPALDVVLIQEAWKDEARHDLLEHPGVVENFPHRVDALEQPGGAGLVVLSRFPIEETAFKRFSAQGRCFKFWEGDCLSGKGVLAVQLNIEGQHHWFGTTHLIACYSGEESEGACDQQDPNGETRWSQLVEARVFMERLAGDDPIVLGGDFNFTRASRYYPGMTARAVPPDPPDTPPANLSTRASRGWREIGEASVVTDRIDYVWTRPGLSERWLAAAARLIFTEDVALPSGESIPISDHPILVALLCLAPPSANACQAP